MSELSHVDDAGRANMVDVSDKPPTARRATAHGYLRCSGETLKLVSEGKTPKKMVVATAELAGIMAAKRTAELVPLCHPLALTKIALRISPDQALPGLHVESEIRTNGPTGVEIEAITAVSIACVTLFDMLKAVDRTMVIDGIEVTSKTGGRSGDWRSE